MLRISAAGRTLHSKFSRSPAYLIRGATSGGSQGGGLVKGGLLINACFIAMHLGRP